MGSLTFTNVYINDAFTIAGPMEKKGQIKKFDRTISDYYFGEKTFEKCEIKMQRIVIENLIKKNGLRERDIDCIIAGELSNQLTASTYTAAEFDIPMLGVYSACACYVESLIILSNLIDSGKMSRGIALTSSHNLCSEKQFRFPIEYGAPKGAHTTFTATGSVGNILSNKKSNIKIESGTIGKVIDYGIKDATNMGAVMAPAAAEVLVRHLKDMKRKANYYDVILTGDLGEVGSTLFKEFLRLNYKMTIENHVDSGCEIYKPDQKNKTNAGASGPVAIPMVLWNKVLTDSRFKKVLVIATGSLHSPVMVNQKNTIPAIAHAISLEVLK